MNPDQTPILESLRADLDRFRCLFVRAMSAVEPDYFAIPISRIDATNETTTHVLERNFSYELYHQLRNQFEEDHFAFHLGGEIDKRGHPIIHLNVIPDLIVHRPGTMAGNLCVIEVKPISGSANGFQKDARNLLQMVECYYLSGALVIFGEAESGIERIRAKVARDTSVLRSHGVDVIWIERAGAVPVLV